VDRYSITGVAPAVATAFRKLKFTASWSSILRETLGGFPNHTGSLTASDRLYDAYAFCGDHDAVTGQHRAFVGCVAYRVKLPADFYAGGVLIKSVTVTVNGDPYLFDGARVAVVNNSTSTPDPDWTNIIAGSVNATGVAKRTAVTTGGSTKWYPTTETKTLVLNASGVQATQYLWIYLSLEDYTKAHRLPWIEGGAALSPDIYITFTDAVSGYTAGIDIGGNELIGDVSANMTPIWTESRSYAYAQLGRYQPQTGGTVQDKLNSMVNCFVDHCTLVSSPGPSGGLSTDAVGINAGVTWGISNVYWNGDSIFAGVMPAIVTVPAYMRVRNIKIAAPTSWASLTFRVCAFIITGSYSETDSRIVPNTDEGFWFGTSKTVSIAGKTATLLGCADITTNDEIVIPVSDFVPYSTDTRVTIYITFMPIDVTASCVWSGGSRRLGYIYLNVASTGYSLSVMSATNSTCYPWIPAYIKITDS
jgi:hypothetical protein